MEEENVADLERILVRLLRRPVRVLRVEPLEKSSRDAPRKIVAQCPDGERALVLHAAGTRGEHEYEVLRAMERVTSVPTPRVHGYDPELGLLQDFVDGQAVHGPMLAGERWAEDLWIDAIEALFDVRREQLNDVTHRFDEDDDADAVVESACRDLATTRDPLVEELRDRLRRTRPDLPTVRFSNGDLYTTNFLVRERRLAAVIDFEHAGFTDPVFELLLPFFMCPELRGRGTEERACRRLGIDPGVLPWYRALEWLDTWRHAHRRGGKVDRFTSDQCRGELEAWLGAS
jgi:aminoglycoside phosphotransferase (APT) family kinase protein